MSRNLLSIRIILALTLCSLSFIVYAQDTMIQRVQKSHGQTSPIIIWLLIAVVPVLFLVFVIAKSNKSKKEVVRDANKEERVIKNTLPKR